MTPKKFPTDVLEQAVNISALVTGISQIRSVENNVERLEKQLTEMRKQRDSLYLTTWDRIKRARASIKGLYGDDSLQYEMVGGTRLSDRKPVRRAPVSVE